MKSRPEPTTTGFAILGMIAIRPMTPYELTKRFDRSIGRAWPRARSKLYEGPKNLVKLGFARANREENGGRSRTVYEITPAGRRALAAWLAKPGQGPELDFEQYLKVFFGDQASTAAVIVNLEAARAWAQDQIAHHIAVGTAYAEGTGPFQERAALLVITGSFLAEFAMTVDRWAEWGLQVAKKWPADPSRATPDVAALRREVKRLRARLVPAPDGRSARSRS